MSIASGFEEEERRVISGRAGTKVLASEERAAVEMEEGLREQGGRGSESDGDDVVMKHRRRKRLRSPFTPDGEGEGQQVAEVPRAPKAKRARKCWKQRVLGQRTDVWKGQDTDQ